MQTRNLARISVSVAMSTALLLTLGRCSPLAPSLDKGSYSSKSSLSMKQTAEILNQSNTSRIETQVSVEHSSEVISGEAFSERISEFSDDSQLITLNQTQLSHFLQTGKTDVLLDHDLVGKTVLLLEVKGSEAEIEELGLNQFETQLHLDDQGSCTLTVQSDVPAEVRDLMSVRVVQASLVLLDETESNVEIEDTLLTNESTKSKTDKESNPASSTSKIPSILEF